MLALDKQMAQPGFWDDVETAREVTRERTRLSEQKEAWTSLETALEDIEILFDLAVEEEDEETGPEILTQIEDLEKRLDQFEIQRMLSGRHDYSNVIVEINAGAGGTEAQDWAEMLLRMYLRWADRNQFKTQIMDLLEGDEAGIKSVTLTISGPYAFGLMRSEIGIHRWCVYRPLMPVTVDIHRSPRSLPCRRLMTKSLLIFRKRTCGSIPSAPAGPGGNT